MSGLCHVCFWCVGSFFFFFNDTATTEIYTLSLHDALPIYGAAELGAAGGDRCRPGGAGRAHDRGAGGTRAAAAREPDAADGAGHPKKLSGTTRAVLPAGPETHGAAMLLGAWEQWPSA